MTGLFRKCFAFVGVLVVLGVAGGASVANASSYLRLDGVVVDPIQYTAGRSVHSYSGPNLEPGVQAPGAQLSGAYLPSANLTLASLDHADLSGGYFGNADLSSADLSFANLSGAYIGDTNFDGANLRNADLSFAGGGKAGVSFLNVDATNANLSGIESGCCSLKGILAGDNSNFTNVDFTGSNLHAYGGGFTNAIFIAADLSTATIDAAADLTGATYSTGSLSNRTLFPTGFDPVARGMVLVPEPGTFLLVGIGLAGMSAVSQRHHRRGTTTQIN